MNITVAPRRTVGITGFDVGGLAPYRGMGQTDYTDLTPGTDTGSGFQVDPSSVTDTSTPINFSDLFSSWITPSTGSSGTAGSSSSTLTSLLAPLESAAVNIGTMFGASAAASQLKPGQTVAAGGTVLSGGPLSGLTSSTAVPLLLLVGGGLLLMMMMGRK